MRPENTLQFIERQIDEGLDRLLSHETFLRSAALVVNFNSYRRKWTRSAMARVLGALELPVKSDHEKMLALLQQLNERLEDLEHRRAAKHERVQVAMAVEAQVQMRAVKGGKKSRAEEAHHVGP
jgi:hypothetical protein